MSCRLLIVRYLQAVAMVAYRRKCVWCLVDCFGLLMMNGLRIVLFYVAGLSALGNIFACGGNKVTKLSTKD